MDRTLAKLTYDLLQWQESMKAAYSPFKAKNIAAVKEKIKQHLKSHYQFQKITQSKFEL